jgi:hypothetical protein
MGALRHVRANCAVPDKGPLDAKALAVLRRHTWERNFYE